MSSIRDGIKRLPVHLFRDAERSAFTLARVDVYPDQVTAIAEGVDVIKGIAGARNSNSRAALMRDLSLALIADQTRAAKIAEIAAQQEPAAGFAEVVAALVDAGLGRG